MAIEEVHIKWMIPMEKIRCTFRWSIGFLCTCMFVLLSPGIKAQSQPPNIVLIIADDLGWNDTEPYGNPDIHTPHIASLAREGMLFRNMFTTTAMCAPTRQQIMTGLYPVRSGAYPNHSWVYDHVKSIPHYFKALGYRTALFGKTHFGPPKAFPYDQLQEGTIEAQTFKQVEKFVQQDSKQPFFLVLASHQPHVPWTKGDTTQYPSAKLKVSPYLVATEATQKALSLYDAEITYLDNQVGQCLDLLEKTGQQERTIVIFTTEQGPQLPFGKWTCYDMGLKTGFIVRWPGKVKPHSSTKAMTQYVDILPTLLEAAGMNPATAQTGIPDAQGNQGFDGKSFLNVLLGRTASHRQYVYGVQTTRGILQGSDSYPIRSVRSDQYLYLQNLHAQDAFSNVITASDTLVYPSWLRKGKDDPASLARATFYQHRPAEELYDVVHDPYQLKNLAVNKQYDTVKKELQQALTAFMQQQGDQDRIESPYPTGGVPEKTS